MGVYLIDWWETFKGWTPYIMGLIVLAIWHFQKGKEVVANEAKNIILKIIEVEKLNNSISNKIAYMNEKVSIDTIKVEIKEFQSKTDNLHKDFDFMYEVLKNHKFYMKNTDIKKILDKYLAQSTLSIVRYNALLKNEVPQEHRRIVANGLQKEYIKCGIEIKNNLMKYVLYKLR